MARHAQPSTSPTRTWVTAAVGLVATAGSVLSVLANLQLGGISEKSRRIQERTGQLSRTADDLARRTEIGDDELDQLRQALRDAQKRNAEQAGQLAHRIGQVAASDEPAPAPPRHKRADPAPTPKPSPSPVPSPTPGLGLPPLFPPGKEPR